MRKVVMVGSRSFPINTVTGTEIVNVVRAYGEEIVLLTRGSEGFDRFLANISLVLGIRCFTYEAHGADNWTRDIELVKDGDEIVAFLDPATLHDPNTGTAHVLEAALRAEKPTKAYTLLPDGALVWAGENP